MKRFQLRSYFALVTAILLSMAGGIYAGSWDTDDRTGQFFLSPKLGLSIPVGALADANYDKVSASWRKEGISLTGEFGFYVSNTAIIGFEASYTSFNPRNLQVFGRGVDDSRVRIRRFGGYYQQLLIPSGSIRPFLKIGFGFFEAERISMPQPGTSPIEYRDYTLGAKPVYSGGIGVMANLNPLLSLQFSIEGVSLNSFSSGWDGEGETLGPLRKNMLYFPIYAAISYHFPN